MTPMLGRDALVSVAATSGYATWAASADAPGLTYLQGAALFVGVPILVLLLIAVPIYAPVWWRRLRRRDTYRADRTVPDQGASDQGASDQDASAQADQYDRNRDPGRDAEQTGDS